MSYNKKEEKKKEIKQRGINYGGKEQWRRRVV